MAHPHARRKSNRVVDKSHAGQRKSAPRKRLRQLQNRIARQNFGQVRQNQTDCTIVVNGVANWRDIFAGETVQIRPQAAKFYGGTQTSALDYLRINSDLNRVSFERSVVSELLTRGYTLEALEVEFNNKERSAWGTCVWYKDHPKYHEPLPEFYKPGAQKWAGFIRSMFKTSRAGEQESTLFSTQMWGAAFVGKAEGILLHKTLVYRKVILAPPAPEQAAAMAA